MTLLFVEDEFYTRQGILTSMDWIALGIDHVESVCDGKAGMAQLAICPDILLTDIRMPYFSGLELAAQAKKNDPTCEVIILSSYSDKEYLFQAIALSTVAYLEKPVDLTALTAAIVQATARRRQSLKFTTLENPPTLTSLPNLENAAYSHSTRTALHFLAANYSDPALSLDSIAAHVHLSAPYLSDSFKKDTGRNLKRVMIDLRTESACQLLCSTTLSISTIAAKCGYRSANYFSKLFRQETGLTPHEYRVSQGKVS